MVRPVHVFMWILGVGSLLMVGLGWHLQASAQGEASPTPDPFLIFYPTVESTGLPPIQTRTPTHTLTVTPSLTAQPPATASATPVILPSNTPTSLPSATNTASFTPTVRLTDTATITTTATPTLTGTANAPATLAPSSTASATATSTTTPTETETATETLTATFTPSETPTPTLTDTPTASFTPSNTPTFTITPSPTSTTTRVPPVIETSRPDNGSAGDNGNDGGLPIWILGLGLIVTLVIGGYILAYSLSSAGVDRYAEGFILADCPICQEGRLELEERPYHVAGIPRVRRAVRCDNCRSVLREVSKRQWRYAIDPSANVALYSEFNNQTIDENELIELAEVVFGQMPSYLDEEEE